MFVSTMRRRLATRVPATPRERTHAVAGAFGVAAAAFVVLAAAVGAALGASVGDIGGGAVAYGVAWLVPAAGLAVAALAWPLWWALVEDRADPTLFETALVGLVVGVVAHPTVWAVYLAGGAAAAAAGVAPPPGSAGLAGPGDLLATAVGYGFTGLAAVGVFTIFAGVGVAAAAASVRDAATDGATP